MHIIKILGISLVLLSVCFLGLQYKGLEVHAFGIKALAMVLLIILYFVRVKKRHPLFILFLVTYTTSEIFNYFTYNMTAPSSESIDMYYLIGNSLYILAYLFLISRILDILNLRKAMLKFPIQIICLFALGVFVAFMITDISKSAIHVGHMYYIELSYNAIVMILVCLALVNFMYNDSKKSMNLLLGSICIVFSEMIQMAYYYITNLDVTLNILHSFFFVGAFVFFYLQSRLEGDEISIFEIQDIKV